MSKRPQKQGPGRKTCPECRRVISSACRTCPGCGHGFPKLGRPVAVREVKAVIVDQTSLLGRLGWNGEAAVEMVRLVRRLYQVCGSWDLLEEMLLAQAERVKQVQRVLKEREEGEG